MTAIRHFPNAPLLQRVAAASRWQTPGWLLSAWQAMERFGQLRAAAELEMLAVHRSASNPQLARQLRDAAAECRRARSSAAPGRLP